MNEKYQSEYQAKLTNIDTVLNAFQSGDTIWCGGHTARPMTLLENLSKLAGKVQNCVLIPTAGLAGFFDFVVNPKLKGCLQIGCTFYDDMAIAGHKVGNISYIPVHLHNGVSRALDAYGLDYYCLTCSPMDENGNFHFSFDNLTEFDCIHWAKEHGKKIVVETNPNVKVAFGETALPLDWVDYIIEEEARPLLQLPDTPVSEVELEIGKHVASLIDDGSTIQLGIGNIPNAVAASLDGKNDLGVHSEMLTSNMARLAKLGVINGRKKTIFWGKMMGSFAVGNQELYDFIAGNPDVIINRASIVTDPHTIAQNYKMVSINAALQVDLTGQVTAETLGTQQFSGTGGASDFARGAAAGKDGKSIVALKSTTKGGTISAIQPILTPGSAVSIMRNDVDFVVTEYGVAKLRGKAIRDRVESLIAISHPDFRDELRTKVQEMGVCYF